ncbi:HPP family protein [Billgrantia diversa]|nr:HPP family protein [Halomonas sp. MCCC 1A13316]
MAASVYALLVASQPCRLPCPTKPTTLTVVTRSFKCGTVIVASFGATSVLIFAAPDSPFAQPRNVLFGSMLSALVGVACFHLLGSTALAVTLAVSLSVLAMQLTHTVHPPGAAATATLGWWYPLMPIGIGCGVMLVVAILVNNLARHRRYPRYW